MEDSPAGECQRQQRLCPAELPQRELLLASVLLLRINVPCEYRQGALAVVLGEIEFGFYHQWFDTIFAASALVAGAARFASVRATT